MSIPHRHKLIIIALLLYWLGLFFLEHIPIPQVVYRAHVSDKTLHFIAYLILTFLLWFAAHPHKKVNWRRASAWKILLTVCVYGLIAELLQGLRFVGRSCDAMDFFTDVLGGIAGLIVFTFLSFWPAALVVTGTTIFFLTNVTRVNLADLLPITNAIFYLFAYAFFTALWIAYIHFFLPIKTAGSKWLTVTLLLPTGFLLFVKLITLIFDRNFGSKEMILSAGAIVTVVAAVFLTLLLRRFLDQKRLANDLKLYE